MSDEVEHQALRAMRDAFVAAYNRMDLDGMLAQLDENVAFTAMNGEVCHGHAEVRAYYEKMMVGPQARVRSSQVTAVEADRLTTLYAEVFGVATGWADTTFNLTDGMKFSARLRWSNTMTRHTGEWKIASFHTSTNIFDNPVLTMTKKAYGLASGVSSAVGVVVGGVVGWLLARR